MNTETRSPSAIAADAAQIAKDVAEFLTKGGKVVELPSQEVTPRKLHSVRKNTTIDEDGWDDVVVEDLDSVKYNSKKSVAVLDNEDYTESASISMVDLDSIL